MRKKSIQMKSSAVANTKKHIILVLLLPFVLTIPLPLISIITYTNDTYANFISFSWEMIAATNFALIFSASIVILTTWVKKPVNFIRLIKAMCPALAISLAVSCVLEIVGLGILPYKLQVINPVVMKPLALSIVPLLLGCLILHSIC